MRQAVIDDIATVCNEQVLTACRAAQGQHIFCSYFLFLLFLANPMEQRSRKTAGLVFVRAGKEIAPVFPVCNYFVVVSNIVDDILIVICAFHKRFINLTIRQAI